MDRYIDIDEERLHKLHDGLEMLEMLDREAMQTFDLNLYGLTNHPSVIDAAKEAIAGAGEGDITEEDIELSEIAVAIPLGADTVYALGGSGIKLRTEGFAYTGEKGEGIRTSNFGYANYRATVALNQFTQLAIASSDSWLEDFLSQYGNKQPVEIKQNIRRTEEATQPDIPVSSAPPVVAPPVPKQTSLYGGTRLSELLDHFLG
jgi:hypothetical protein